MKIRYDADLYENDENFDEEEFKEMDRHRQAMKKHKIKMTYKEDNKKRNKPKRGGKDVWDCD